MRRHRKFPTRRGQIFRVPIPAPGLGVEFTVQRRPHARKAFYRRGKFFTTPVAVVTVTTQTVPPQSLSTHRSRIAPSRRGKYLPLPPVAVTVTVATPPPQSLSARRSRLAPFRRGQYQSVPPVVTVTAEPFIAGHRPRGITGRRGRFLTAPVTVQVPVPAFTARRRSLGILGRRGRYLSVPVPVFVAGVQVYPPQAIGHRARWVPFIRRGKIGPPPPSSFAGTVVVLPPPQSINGRRARFGPARRGSFQAVTVAVTLPPPQPIAGKRSRAILGRRGRYLASPVTVVTVQVPAPPATISSHLRRLPFLRRGKFTPVVPPPKPPVYPPFTITRRRFPLMPFRRGRFGFTKSSSQAAPTIFLEEILGGTVSVTGIGGAAKALANYNGSAVVVTIGGSESVIGIEGSVAIEISVDGTVTVYQRIAED